MARRERFGWAAAVAVCLLGAITLAYVQSAPSAQAPAPVATQAAFDRGMAAGQQYEQWFCANPALEGK